MTHTYISKDKWKLNTIIKNHPIAHVTFLFSFEIQYLLVYLIFEERMFLSFTRDRNNCRWSVKIREKKSSEDKFDYRERTVEMNKVLISALKPLGFLGAVTTMTTTLLMNLIMMSKESKLLYYGQAVFSQSRFHFLYFLQCVAISHFYNDKYVIIPGLKREVADIIGICSRHMYERYLSAIILNSFQLSLLCYRRLQPLISRNNWHLYKILPSGWSWK